MANADHPGSFQWSWASTNRRVEYACSEDCPAYYSAKVETVSIQASPDAFGEVKSGRLFLRCEYFFRSTLEINSFSLDHDTETPNCTDIYLDVGVKEGFPSDPEIKFFIAPIRYYRMTVSAFILEPTGQGVKGQYRRVGLIKNVGSGSILLSDAARYPKFPVEDSDCRRR